MRRRHNSRESWARDRLAALLQQIVANRREAIERGSQHARRQLAAAEKEPKLVSPGK